MAHTTVDALPFTGDPEADAFLVREPLALLIGFVLDQQVTVQKAFAGPLELQRRIGSVDARTIAEMDADALAETFRQRPALHRFPAAMAERVQALCAAVTRDHGGDPRRIWEEAKDGEDLRRRLLALPGIGPMKAAALIVILGKRLGVAPRDWEGVAPDHPTLGDVDSPEALAAYQAGKRASKAAVRAADTRAPESK